MVCTIWVTTDSYEGPTLTFPKLWPILLFLSPFIVGLKVFAWHQLTKGLGIALDLNQTLKACVLSILGRYIPGKVFFVVGRLQAYGLKGEALKQGTFGMVLEFIYETMAGAFLMMVALGLGYFSGTTSTVLWPLSVCVILGGIFSPWLLKRLSHLHRTLSISIPAQGNVASLILMPLIWTLLQWAFYLGSLFLWMGEPIGLSLQSMFAIGAILSFSSLVGTLSLLTPGGLGVREAMATMGFTALGIDWQQGLALAFAARCILWGSELFCGGLWLCLDKLRPKPRNT